jgi:prephenate dehydratase
LALTYEKTHILFWILLFSTETREALEKICSNNIEPPLGGFFYAMKVLTDIQQKKVAIQGIAGCFHHVAAKKYFEESFQIDPSLTFDASLDKVRNGDVDFALMAIENSIAGSIIPNYQLLRKSGLRINGEISIHIGQHLLALPGTRIEDIVEVQSHPMALHQCKDFFRQYPVIKLVESPDTAYSAQKVDKEQLVGVAAIGSELAAATYHLDIVAPSIESHKDNYTRFLVISTEDREPNPDKASIYFQTAHTSGSLGSVLQTISSFGVNLSKIQSHPVPSKNRLYGFYADLEISDRQQFEKILEALRAETTVMEVLGLYKRREDHD